MFFNAQVFSDTAPNPIGIYGAQEIYYVLLALWAVISILRRQSHRSQSFATDIYVFLTPLAFTAYGAFAANLTFGQPLLLGILEERRVFALYIYFPIIDMLRAGWVRVERLESVILAVMAAASGLMAGVYFDLIEGWNEVRSSNIALRDERLSIGASFIAAFLPLAMMTARGTGSVKRFTVLILGGFALIFIAESRQLLIGLLLALFWSLRLNKIIIYLLIAAVLALALSPLISSQIDLYQQLFSQVGSSEYTQRSWRALGIAEVTSALQDGEVWGHGALLPAWNGGFQSVIGGFFYLADIGLFGTIYRYGLFGAFWYAMWLFLQTKSIFGLPAGPRRHTYSGVFIFLLVLLPIAAPLEFRGFLAAPLLAITTFLASEFRTARSDQKRRSFAAKRGQPVSIYRQQNGESL